MRVDEGVFELQIGGTIDLTNQKMLLAITRYGTDQRCCEFRLNGDRVTNWQVGGRVDLKEFRGTRDYVKDRDQCFLDIVDLVTPKGSPGTATFRLHCI